MPFQFTCEQCGTTFTQAQQTNRGRPFRFCSRACSADYRFPRPDPLVNPDGSIRVPLGKGKFAVIDAIDAERVLALRWSLYGSYAMRKHQNNGRGRRQRNLLLHRFIMDDEDDTSVNDGMEADHIDRNTLNCRRSNLRTATKQQNRHNQRKISNNTSGFIGVHKQRHRWRAVIQQDGKYYHLGTYDTPEEAALAYDAEVRRLRGEFAVPNFPDEVEAA